MALIGVLQTLVDGQVITAAQHNSNYGDIKTAFNTSAVLTDVAKTITVSHLWAASQTFAGATMTGDLLFTDATFDIGKTGATRPRHGFFSGDVTVGGTLWGGSVISAAQVSAFGMTTAVHAWNAGYKAIQLTNSVGFMSRGLAGELFLYIGSYNDGADKYAVGPAVVTGSYQFYGGAHRWSTAPGGAVDSAAVYTDRMTLSATSLSLVADLLFLDNTYDIGKAGATRPRDGFFSRNVTIAGQAIFSSTTQPIYLQNNAQIVWRNQANTADAFGIGTDITDILRVGVSANFAGLWLGSAGKKISFYGGGGTGGVVQPVIVGAKGGNVALANLLTALGAANLNLITDNTT